MRKIIEFYSDRSEHQKPFPLIAELDGYLNAFKTSRNTAIKDITLSIVHGATGNNDTVRIHGLTSTAITSDEDIQLSLLMSRVNLFIKENANECKTLSFTIFFVDSDTVSKIISPELAVQKSDKNANQETPPLNVLPIAPLYTLDKMVLNEPTEEDLLGIVTLIESQKLIYETWGFIDIEPNPKSVVNFYGPPGTGKTMAAHALASCISKKILSLNYADIESKFVGDAPKNLVSAFGLAKQHDAVLFFDEADSFLGKRIVNVSSSSDQAVNSLRSQLLILLESFTGLVIFATNLMENYDKAFNSRILKSIYFNLPDMQLRAEWIEKMLPKRLPLVKPFTPNEIKRLAKITDGFSGREIKNAVLSALMLAAKNKEKLDFAIFKSSFTASKKAFDAVSNRISPLAKLDKKALESKIKSNLKLADKKKQKKVAAKKYSVAR